MQSNKSIKQYYKSNMHYYERSALVIQILEKNPDKIDWFSLSHNPNAIQIIKPLNSLSHNPNAIQIIKPLNYDAMKQTMQPFAEELAAYVFHPLRMNRIAVQYNIPFEELINDIY